MATDELKNLFVGQSLDLYWTRNMVVPSVEQYFQMVENSKCFLQKQKKGKENGKKKETC